LVLVLALGLGLLPRLTHPTPPPLWEAWETYQYTLQVGESLHFRVDFTQIPVRNWRLVVEGDNCLSDLHILRLKDESLLYFETDESRHEVTIPWGKGEEISAVLTASRSPGVFTVFFLGPPPESAQAAYSYRVNRALEAYTAGRLTEAERLCQEALQEDSDDGVARVLLAGFLRDRNYYEKAADLIAEALATSLPPDMRDLAIQLQEEIARMRAPLSADLREGLVAVERHLEAGDSEAALRVCEQLLARNADVSAQARSRILQQQGRALHRLGRHFEAVDTFTQALNLASSREDEALIYFRMAELFWDMGNLSQAKGAFGVARQYGLPPGLDIQAQEALRRISSEQP
jgi:hypothetical protein